jgi:hypothetical protein
MWHPSIVACLILEPGRCNFLDPEVDPQSLLKAGEYTMCAQYDTHGEGDRKDFKVLRLMDKRSRLEAAYEQNKRTINSTTGLRSE